VSEVVEGLLASSPRFRQAWEGHEVDPAVEGQKTFLLPGRGELTFDTAAFTVDGRPGFKLIVFTPATDNDRLAVKCLVEQSNGSTYDAPSDKKIL
jgi:hypothetical protein